jgi:hypothetical protein
LSNHTPFFGIDKPARRALDPHLWSDIKAEQMSLLCGKEVRSMIEYTHIETAIGDVTEIRVEPLQSDDPPTVYQRCLTVRTKQGEIFALVLRAKKKRNLTFRKSRHSDWLTPILYQPDTGKE